MCTLPKRKVKIIANIGVGVDHIDLQSAKENNVIITNTPDVLTEATDDVATLLLLSVTRNAFLMETMLRQGEWKGFSLTENLGVSVRGKTLGLVGMGRIGKAFGKRAHEVFGMKVLYYNRSPVTDLKFEASVRFDLDALLEESDVISLHLSSDKGNKNFISKSRMKKIRPSSFLINPLSIKPPTIFLETKSKSSEPDGSKRSANTVAIKKSSKSEAFLLIILNYINHL